MAKHERVCVFEFASIILYDSLEKNSGNKELELWRSRVKGTLNRGLIFGQINKCGTNESSSQRFVVASKDRPRLVLNPLYRALSTHCLAKDRWKRKNLARF